MLGPKDIEIKIHGLTAEDHGKVPARVFANKLKAMVSVLEAADIIANGELTHNYIMHSMHMSNPTAVLREIPLTATSENKNSAIPVFNNAIESIKTNDQGIEKLGPVIKKIALLTGGADKEFSFAEVKAGGDSVVRIDAFLQQRASAIKKSASAPWFDGAVYGSFDGVLKLVDLRGDLPLIKLVLSAGGKEIDCVCRKEDINTLKKDLAQRVVVYGRAIYSSSDPLPKRVEVSSFTLVKEDADFTKWKGSFHPFEESWDGEE
jgi:hypothetical protein